MLMKDGDASCGGGVWGSRGGSGNGGGSGVPIEVVVTLVELVYWSPESFVQQNY